MNQRTMFDADVWKKFIQPGEIVEVRIPHVFGSSPAWGNEYARGTVAGFFDDHKAFVEVVRQAEKTQHDGIYFTLQVIDPRLIGRAFNRLRPGIKTTADTNVLAYRWLPIDIDPVRPAGVSSSDSELKEALQTRAGVMDWCIAELKFPKPLKAISGNGGHLLFRLPDLPITDENKKFIQSTLAGLDQEFSTDRVKIDTTVFNPSRIWKLYGTTARKGDPVPAGPNREARPHRLAFIEKEKSQC